MKKIKQNLVDLLLSPFLPFLLFLRHSLFLPTPPTATPPSVRVAKKVKMKKMRLGPNDWSVLEEEQKKIAF